MLLSIILREEYASKWWHGWQAASFFRERGRWSGGDGVRARDEASQQRRAFQRRPWRDKHRDKEITSSWTDWRTAGAFPVFRENGNDIPTNVDALERRR